MLVGALAIGARHLMAPTATELAKITYDPCNAFDPIPEWDHGLTLDQAHFLPDSTKTVILGENHGYRDMSLACIQQIIDETNEDTHITLAVEGRAAGIPLSSPKDFIHEKFEINEETLCSNPKVTCIGWDDIQSVDEIKKQKTEEKEILAIIQTFKKRNVALLETMFNKRAESPSDLLIFSAGSSHLKQDIPELDQFIKGSYVPDLLDNLIEREILTKEEAERINIFSMPDREHAVAELGLPTTGVGTRLSDSIPCSSDGADGKRAKIDRRCT